MTDALPGSGGGAGTDRGRRRKILLLIVTLLPSLLLMADFVWTGAWMASLFASGADAEPDIGPFIITLLFVLPAVAILGIMILTAVYVINAARNERITKEMKVFWAVVFFLGLITLTNPVLMPLYWYYYIWREPETAADLAPGA